MKFEKGCVSEQVGKFSTVFVCVDSAIRSDGSIGMLNGSAGALGAKHPTLGKSFGEKVKDLCGDRGEFFLYAGGKVGMFQTGVRPQDGISLYLIAGAVQRLKRIASEFPDRTYAVEWPCRGEPDWMVGRMYDTLPDNVTVFKP
jgi:hypothetical protein